MTLLQLTLAFYCNRTYRINCNDFFLIGLTPWLLMVWRFLVCNSGGMDNGRGGRA